MKKILLSMLFGVSSMLGVEAHAGRGVSEVVFPVKSASAPVTPGTSSAATAEDSASGAQVLSVSAPAPAAEASSQVSSRKIYFSYYAAAMDGVGTGNYIAEVKGHSDAVFIVGNDEAKLAQAAAGGVKVILGIHWVFFDAGMKLVPDWRARWQAYVNRIQSSRQQILAFYIADEPHWIGSLAATKVPYDEMDRQLDEVSRAVKASFPGIPTAISYAWTSMQDMKAGKIKGPKAIDWLGFDCYQGFENCNGLPISTYLSVLKGSLSAQQKIILIPPAGKVASSSLNEGDLIYMANQYLSIAQNDPRVIMVMPFLWQSFSNSTEAPWTGARDMPSVRKRYKEIGALLSGKAPPVSEGLFRVGKSVYFSNGSEYCGYTSEEHLKGKTNIEQPSSVREISEIPASMKDDGICER